MSLSELAFCWHNLLSKHQVCYSTAQRLYVCEDQDLGFLKLTTALVANPVQVLN